MEFSSLGEDTDTSLLREIDEELRQEHFSKLWTRYGKVVIGAAIILVGSVAGYKGWQAYDFSQRSELADRFSLAVTTELDGDLSQAYQAYSTLSADASGGYEILARFRAASVLSQQGDRTAAAMAYAALAGDSDVDRQFRDLAVLLQAMNEMDTAEPAGIISRMAPLTGDDNPWRFSAREVSALAAMRAGDRQQATDLLSQLIADAAAPSGARARAQELLAAIDAP